jgi:hypothetical protein
VGVSSGRREGKWEVRSGKWEVRSGKWEVRSEKWVMGRAGSEGACEKARVRSLACPVLVGRGLWGGLVGVLRTQREL